MTGTHALKIGFNHLSGANLNANRTVDSATSYRFNNAIPNLITEYATPNARHSHLTEGAVFAQDKWTISRLTINAGLRFDYYYTHFPEQVLGPGPLVPNRNITFAATDWYQWKNISPRLGAAYDLFGNGRTAIKGSASRFTLAVDPTTGNPYFNLANFVTRSWSDADRDYVPDCNLLDPQTNGECGTISDLRFGGLLPSTTTDPDTLQGWGKRPGDWQFSVGVQHELAPRVGIDVAYFRRSFFNFMVVQNRAVQPSDYSPFSITAPKDPRLPDGGGYVVGGLFDLNPNKVGAVDNFVTFADNLGGQSEVFNGMDFTINARPRDGVLLQGGVSTGRSVTDNCNIVRQYPQLGDALHRDPLEHQPDRRGPEHRHVPSVHRVPDPGEAARDVYGAEGGRERRGDAPERCPARRSPPTTWRPTRKSSRRSGGRFRAAPPTRP